MQATPLNPGLVAPLSAPGMAWRDAAERNNHRRAAANRENAAHSTGPRTEAGKLRSSRNAISHGLTSRAAVLPTEDLDAYLHHCAQFGAEYQPKTITEQHLVQELADTSWRLNRIPRLEAEALSRAQNPPSEEAAIAFDIVDAHRALASLGLHSQRLSRQFQKALATLRELQQERRRQEECDLARAASLLQLHKHKDLPFAPADFGFVFSNSEIEQHGRRLALENEALHFEHVLFSAPPPLARTASTLAAN